MTLHDLVMMSKYRRRNPSLESLLSLIAQWTGVYKPEEPPPPPVSSVPNPTASIRAAFAGAKFHPSEGIVNV